MRPMTVVTVFLGVVTVAAVAAADPCVVPDNGSGTATMPPVGCEYLPEGDVFRIIDGLPPGTTLELSGPHSDLNCTPGAVCSMALPPGTCEVPGGSLGGDLDCFSGNLHFDIVGTGDLAGFFRSVIIPVSSEVHTEARTPGAPVQDFDQTLFRHFGQILGDPDFDLLRIVGGTDFGLPSPGHTTLTQVGSGQWAVDSFFDITYRIDFVGAPGGALAGRSGSTTATIRVATEPPPVDCLPRLDATACEPVLCSDPDDSCSPACVHHDLATGLTSVTGCECRASSEWHVEWSRETPPPCVLPDNGTGTATLPPAGCMYETLEDVYQIIDGLPAGTTIELAGPLTNFVCTPPAFCSLGLPAGQCETPGGSLGGDGQCFSSDLQLNLVGTGSLTGFSRSLSIPVGGESHSSPRAPGEPVQSFDTEMFMLHGQLPPGDPDFDLLRLSAGTGFGLPSPGHTTLTRLPSADFAVDSFFDITYRIDFIGAPGSVLGGMSGSTTGTIRASAGVSTPVCVGSCPDGMSCSEERVEQPDGTVDVCCAMVPISLPLIFADGFESGDTATWSATTP